MSQVLDISVELPTGFFLINLVTFSFWIIWQLELYDFFYLYLLVE